MTAFRLTALLLALGLVAACDEPPKPPAPLPTPPRTEVVPAPASKPPASVPAEPVVSAPAASKPSDSTPAVSTKPAAPQGQPQKSQPAAAKVPSPAVAKAPAAKPQPLPPVKLDLRLPAELVEQLEPGGLLAELPSEPLLPPLFVEKPAEPGPFQLNGRLITNDQNESYWDSVEGAELQFEFRN